MVSHAWRDPNLMTELCDDPERVFRERGIIVPEGVVPDVIERIANSKLLHLPPSNLDSDYELTNDQLKGVVGGTDSNAPTEEDCLALLLAGLECEW